LYWEVGQTFFDKEFFFPLSKIPIVKNEIENLPYLLEQLEPREKAYILLKILPFVMPRMNADEIELPEPVIIQIHPDL
jgi:hypothetical protein